MKSTIVRKAGALAVVAFIGLSSAPSARGEGAPFPDPSPTPPLFSVEDLRQDFLELRRILEQEHACPYEYTSKAEFDALFEEGYRLIDRPMRYEEFFRIAAPLAAKVGCLHTALWMPGRFFDLGKDNMFPLHVRLIEGLLVVTGGHGGPPEIPVGSVILDINGLAAEKVFDALRAITSADALNPYFIDTQVEKRFSMFYASVFGFPERYSVVYTPPGGKARKTAVLKPTDIATVRKDVFANFDHPPLTLDLREDIRTAVMTVKTFIYYDRVDYFREFMDRSFREIKDKGIENLILDLRGNDGGDPFCSVILYAYLEKEPAPYFAERYGKYAPLAEPVPLPEDRFTGNLYTLLDGRCGSTNGHFSALLKYHGLGKFVGTPSGSTYICNAGKNSEVRLDKTQIILTLGRSSFAAAVEGMDKSKPILPDHPVRETYRDFLDGRDVYLETALELIKNGKAGKPPGPPPAPNVPDIAGCWEGAPEGKFAERNRQLRLFARKPDGRLAITLIYDLTPRCQVWEYDLEVTVEDGAVSWEAHRGRLSEDGNAMTVVKEWKGERSTWTFVRRKDLDDWIRELAASSGKGYAYEVPEGLDDGWECADLADVGIDRQAITRFVDGITQGRHDDIHSLVIVRNGKLVLEEYFATNGERHGPFVESVFRKRPHHLASVTKGVLSALCGIAVDRGLIKGVDEPIARHLPAYAGSLTGKKRAITMGHLLTMTPGWAWDQTRYPWSDPRNDAAAMYDQKDVIRYVVEKPLASDPGARFRYSNGAPTVLGAVLDEACGMDADRFAEKELFDPLGIPAHVWTRYFDGRLEADGGLALRPRDLAKIGQLFLDRGEWRGRRVVSEEWVGESTRQRIPLGGLWGWGYGYYWMQVDLKTDHGPVHSYFVPGDGGQLLAVFPDLNMVIVLTAGNYGRDDKSVCFSMIRQGLLPAILPEGR